MSASTSSQVSNASTTNSASIAAFHNSRKKFKLLVIGSASVGKTSVLRQFVYHTFDPKSTQTTIGCDFWHRNLTVNYAPSSSNSNSNNSNNNTTNIKSSPDQLNNSNNDSNNNNNTNNKTKSVTAQLAVWDTAGMDAGFESLAPSFFRGADGAMLVYDLTNPQSFHQAKTWRDKFVAHAGYQAPILLVGNKIDLVEQRKVTKEMADEFVRESIQIANDSQSSLLQAANHSITTNSNNGNKGILVCGHVEITAADSEAVESAFVQLTQAMLEVEKTRSASEIVSQKDLKRVRLGSVPPGTGKDAAAAAGAGKKCSC